MKLQPPQIKKTRALEGTFLVERESINIIIFSRQYAGRSAYGHIISCVVTMMSTGGEAMKKLDRVQDQLSF